MMPSGSSIPWAMPPAIMPRAEVSRRESLVLTDFQRTFHLVLGDVADVALNYPFAVQFIDIT